MQKEKLIKISLIFGILFFIGIFMVSASNDISLRCVSDYGEYLESEEDGEFISGEFFNEENLMILDYKILSGFTEIKNSNLKVRLEGLNTYDEGMINSCFKLLHDDENITSFKLAINYKNYLNYSEKIDPNTVTGDMLFPNEFKIVLYANVQGEEITVLERNVYFDFVTKMSEVSLLLQPYDISGLGLNSYYSFLKTEYDDTLKRNVYTYDLCIGAWEDEKYIAFDYYLFDNSIPRIDVKSVSAYANSLNVTTQEELPGLSIELANEIDGRELEGNKKLVLKYNRASSAAVDSSSYKYYLNFTDMNGKVTNAELNINFKQYQRISYMEGLSRPELAKTAVVKEKFSILKANEDGSLDVTLTTQSYNATKFELYDEHFNLLDESHFDAKAYSSTVSCLFKDLESGWYNFAIYSSRSTEPSNFYTFYFEKEPVKVETNLYYKDNKIEVVPNKDIEIVLDTTGAWVLFDRVVYVGGQELFIENDFYFDLIWNNTRFDEYFKGAAYLNANDGESFVFSANTIGNDYESYTIKLSTVAKPKYELSLSLERNVLRIPTIDEFFTVSRLFASVTKNGVEVDEEYGFRIYFNGKEHSYDSVTIYDDGTTDKSLRISPDALAGDYFIEMYLKSDDEIAVSVPFELKEAYTGGSGEEGEDTFVLKILNNSEIAVPNKQGHKNKIYLEGRVIKNGTETNETGEFSLLSNPDGVSLSGNLLTVLSNANIGTSFDVKFSYNDNSITKTFTLVAQGDNNDSGIVDENDKPIGGKPASSIVFRGFDSDKLETKYLTFDDISGESKVLTYTCYDSNGNIVQNPQLEISGSDIANGILIVPNYSNRTVTVYANGLFENRDFTINVVSNNQNILTQKVTACRPDTWECYLDFDEYKFVRNSKFSASGTFSSFFETDTTVSFVLVLYDKNNKIIRYNVDSQVVKFGETKSFATKFVLPVDTEDITAKAFFINGTNIADSSRIFAKTKIITNAKEVY